MMGGRKKDSIWNFFHEIQSKTGKGSRAKCKFCSKEIQGIVSRMKFHYSNCSLALDAENDLTHNVCEVDSPQPQPSTSVDMPEGCGIKKRPTKVFDFHSSKKFKMDSFVTKTTPEQKKELDIQVARMIYATNTAFHAVENYEFQKLIEKLRPGYAPPRKHAIGSYLLDDVYEQEIEKCKKLLKNEFVSMSIDGWSNVNRDPIIACSITSKEGNVYLIDTFDTAGKSHTAEYLQEIFEQSVIKAESKFNCKVKSIVTDNASNMSKMRKNVNDASEKEANGKTQDIPMITYGCSAHLLNLLAKDLQLQNVTEHIVQVIKYFRNHDFAKTPYTKAGGSALKLPQEVRWNSMCDCLDSYVKNWPALLTVVEGNNQIDPKIKEKVLNVIIKRNAEDAVIILKPIAKALDNIQSGSCTISEAVVEWKKLELELKEVLDKKQMISFVKRYEQALTAGHFLAFLINLKLKIENKSITITQKEKEAAVNFAKDNYGTEFLSLLMKLLTNSSPFSGALMDDSILKNLTALEWWASFATVKECVGKFELQAIKQLLTASASSAGIERIFSTFNLVHSKLRNRLGIEKASKLVFLFKALNNEMNKTK